MGDLGGMDNHRELSSVADELLVGPVSMLVIDLSDVCFLSASVCGLLVSIYKRAKAHRVDLFLIVPQATAAENVLRCANIHCLVEIYPSIDIFCRCKGIAKKVVSPAPEKMKKNQFRTIPTLSKVCLMLGALFCVTTSRQMTNVAIPAKVETNFAPLPQSCQETDCPDNYQCVDGNCIQCGEPEDIFPLIEQRALKEYATQKGLMASTTIRLNWLSTYDSINLNTIFSEFNTIRISSYMKQLQPEQGVFKFDKLDEKLQFALQKEMKVWYKPLIYFPPAYSSPEWLNFTTDPVSCGNWSTEELEQIMVDHISTVVHHSKDKGVFGYVVINEGLIHDWGIKCWDKIPNLIPKAFQAARDADPNALLVIDDGLHNKWWSDPITAQEKIDEYFSVLNLYLQQGVPIDVAGIHMLFGLQDVNWGTEQEEVLRSFFQQAQEAELQAWITEMAISQPDQSPAGLAIQKKVYKSIISICLEYPHCSVLQIPHLQPELFDEDYKRKPAYDGVMEAIQENTTRSCSLQPHFTSQDSVAAKLKSDFGYRVGYENPLDGQAFLSYLKKPDWLNDLGDTLFGTPEQTGIDTVLVTLAVDDVVYDTLLLRIFVEDTPAICSWTPQKQPRLDLRVRPTSPGAVLQVTLIEPGEPFNFEVYNVAGERAYHYTSKQISTSEVLLANSRLRPGLFTAILKQKNRSARIKFLVLR